ncbi:MBL fold metallo-hydrolase [Flagellimonas flava]|uniref:Pyrroloquinoline quinone biosynthesis protein B n=1 Tax=Flagellimonas flava TaxID=570519 RepID=A0A1M5HJB8_9FLAO|nr:MBL fold metallo-hydrolase [Allomuricauda flava]SHG16027.1 pyrroloquinoline quinone biosynthesis protein B [Allomuricauda flava]
MKPFFFLFLVFLISCGPAAKEKQEEVVDHQDKVSLYVLGTVQDGGSPHIGCKRDCCKDLFQNPDFQRKVVSLGVVDNENQRSYLFEASPDLPSQLKSLKEFSGKTTETPDGIFLTHAHIGHYAGLMFLGREALGASKVPVFTMPRMKSFLETNGPWEQLVHLKNIKLHEMGFDQEQKLTPNITVTPFQVPHRDEYSETVGFIIKGPNKTVLFIPDIDKWHKWERDITKEIQKVDLAFLDATFFDAVEINNRDITEIPHPFVIESMEVFDNLSLSEREKIHFIHFNHTNPLLNPEGKAHQKVTKEGFKVAEFHQRFGL